MSTSSLQPSRRSDASRISRLAQRGFSRKASRRDDERVVSAVTSWLNQTVQDENTRELLEVQKSLKGTPDVYAYWRRMVLQASGVQEVTLDGTSYVLFLLGIPLFLANPDAADITCSISSFRCQSEVERSLEEAFDLGFLHGRLASFPVSPIALSQLSPVDCRRLALDIVTQGDSPLVAPPVIEFHSHDERNDLGLVWPFVWQVRADDYERLHRKLGDVSTTNPVVARLKHRMDALLERDLAARVQPRILVKGLMPVFFADLFTAYNHVAVNMFIRRATKLAAGRAKELHWRLVSGRMELRVTEAGNRSPLAVYDLPAFEGFTAEPAQFLREVGGRHHLRVYQD